MDTIHALLSASFALAVLAVVIALYFLPAIIANRRKHNNAVAITVLNIFAGWTFIGWIIAIVWAFTDNVKQNKTELKTIEQ